MTTAPQDGEAPRLPTGAWFVWCTRMAAQLMAVAVAFAIISGFFLSITGVDLRTAWWLSLGVALVCSFALIEKLSGPVQRSTVLIVLGALIVGALIPNDVYNKDIVWQIGLADESRYLNTLVMPGFFGSTYTTKYDGWTFLFAGLAQATAVDPMQFVRHANIVLYPAFATLALKATDLFAIRRYHALGLLAAAVLVGGDAVRLISFAGPRSIATLLQLYGALLFLEATWTPHPHPRRRQLVAAGALLASGICHNFYALANTILLGCIGAIAVLSRLRRDRVRLPVLGTAAYAACLLAFLLVKRAAIPEGAADAPASESTAVAGFGWPALFGFRWSEYGSLWPYWSMLAASAAFALSRSDDRRPPARLAVVCVWAFLLLPLIAVLFPPTRHVIADVTTGSRLMRLAPISAVLVAWAAYAWFASARGEGWRRHLVTVAAVFAAISLIPSAVDTAKWYGHVWTAVRLGPSDDRHYYGLSVFLGPGAEAGCPILASSRLDALRLAGILRGHRVYFHEPDGALRYATWQDTYPAVRNNREWFYVVTHRGERLPTNVSQPVFRSGDLVVWRADPPAACQVDR